MGHCDEAFFQIISKLIVNKNDPYSKHKSNQTKTKGYTPKSLYIRAKVLDLNFLHNLFIASLSMLYLCSCIIPTAPVDFSSGTWRCSVCGYNKYRLAAARCLKAVTLSVYGCVFVNRLHLRGLAPPVLLNWSINRL